MSRIEIAPEVREDLDRILEHLNRFDVEEPSVRINEIVHGKRRISADTALRLARYFGTTERFWMNLQTRFDLEVEKDRLGSRLDEEVRAFNAA